MKNKSDYNYCNLSDRVRQGCPVGCWTPRAVGVSFPKILVRILLIFHDILTIVNIVVDYLGLFGFLEWLQLLKSAGLGSATGWALVAEPNGRRLPGLLSLLGGLLSGLRPRFSQRRSVTVGIQCHSGEKMDCWFRLRVDRSGKEPGSIEEAILIKRDNCYSLQSVTRHNEAFVCVWNRLAWIKYQVRDYWRYFFLLYSEREMEAKWKRNEGEMEEKWKRNGRGMMEWFVWRWRVVCC